MKNKILCLDIEASGLDKLSDHIIQLSYVIYDFNENKTLKEYNRIIRPMEDNFTIADEAFEKHGFTKEFILENGIDIKYAVQELLHDISQCDALLTYNGNSFDLAFIYEYCRRYEIDFNIPSSMVCYDSYVIEQKLNPRTLEAVYKRYTGNELSGAHNALFDVKATIDIFKKQIELTELNDTEYELLSLSGFVGYDKDRNIVFTNGKYKNKAINDIIKSDPRYISWVFENVLKDEINTKKKIIEEYKNLEK